MVIMIIICMINILIYSTKINNKHSIEKEHIHQGIDQGKIISNIKMLTITSKWLKNNKKLIEISHACKNDKPNDHCSNCSYKELSPLIEEIRN